MRLVETVRGPVPVDDLGRVLTHEHLVVSNPELARDYPEIAWPRGRDSEIDRVSALLSRVRERGIGTVVDCTAFFHGRDVDFVQRVNDRVDLHVVMSTGIYTYDYLPYVIKYRDPGPGGRDVLTDMFVRDVEVGIGSSGVKAGNIKVATDAPGLSPNNERILRAAARAAVETNVPITTHTVPTGRLGRLQQRVFEDEGVDLSRVVIGHTGDSTDLDYLRAVMDDGSTIASDRFGLEGAGRATAIERYEVISTLCDEGYTDRIVLAHDTLMACDWMDSFDHYPDTWTPTHVSDTVLPALEAHGITKEQIDQMMVHNPARLLGRPRA